MQGGGLCAGGRGHATVLVTKLAKISDPALIGVTAQEPSRKSLAGRESGQHHASSEGAEEPLINESYVVADRQTHPTIGSSSRMKVIEC